MRLKLTTCLFTLTVHSLKLVVPEKMGRIIFGLIFEDGEDKTRVNESFHMSGRCRESSGLVVEPNLDGLAAVAVVTC